MKTIFINVLFLFFVVSATPQNFYVIKVEGKVLLQQKELKTGDKLTEESMLEFTSPTDKLYLLSPSNGYFLLSPSQPEKNNKSWIISLKEAVIPQNKYYKTASRGTSENNPPFDDIYDLMGFFRDNVLIIDSATFSINPNKIILDETSYFEFLPPGKNKSVHYKATKESFSLNPATEKENLEMDYIKKGERQKIGEFTLRTIPRKTIADELAVFYKNQDKNNSTIIYFEQIVPFITSVYGNTNMNVVKDIIINDLNVPLKLRDK